jgi:hypothetical protein
MGSNWKLVAFPLILPWRKEFWTLPLYFVDLQVGVIPGWPEVVPYRGRPLPPEAVASGNELRHYHPGELRQRQAFKNFLETREEVDDIVRELKGLPREALEEGLPSAEAWSLVWQMEKMQADEEARMIHVDQGETWLAEILSPEPWDNQKSFGATGLKEMVDPELARLRYLLWQREMAMHLKNNWAPFLLGRTARAIFGSLRGWQGWNFIKLAKVQLPGVRSEGEWREASGGDGSAWRGRFTQHLEACLEAAGDLQTLTSRAGDVQDFLEQTVLSAWPGEPVWHFDLEIWTQEEDEGEDGGPVLCWAGAGADILPG